MLPHIIGNDISTIFYILSSVVSVWEKRYTFWDIFNTSERLRRSEFSHVCKLSHTGSAIPAAVGMAGTAGMASHVCNYFTLYKCWHSQHNPQNAGETTFLRHRLQRCRYFPLIILVSYLYSRCTYSKSTWDYQTYSI